jgi:hypothetical protein
MILHRAVTEIGSMPSSQEEHVNWSLRREGKGEAVVGEGNSVCW